MTVIKQPMDFATMRQKMDQRVYVTLREFESDVELIAHNAQKYNAPNTIYHKQASRLLDYATRYFDKIRESTADRDENVVAQEYQQRQQTRASVEPSNAVISRSVSPVSAKTVTFQKPMESPSLLSPSEQPRKKRKYTKRQESRSSLRTFSDGTRQGVVSWSSVYSLYSPADMPHPFNHVFPLRDQTKSMQYQQSSDRSDVSDKNWVVPTSYMDYGACGSIQLPVRLDDGRTVNIPSTLMSQVEKYHGGAVYGDVMGSTYARSIRSFVSDVGEGLDEEEQPWLKTLKERVEHRIADMTKGAEQFSELITAQVKQPETVEERIKSARFPDNAHPEFKSATSNTIRDCTLVAKHQMKLRQLANSAQKTFAQDFGAQSATVSPTSPAATAANPPSLLGPLRIDLSDLSQPPEWKVKSRGRDGPIPKVSTPKDVSPVDALLHQTSELLNIFPTRSADGDTLKEEVEWTKQQAKVLNHLRNNLLILLKNLSPTEHA